MGGDGDGEGQGDGEGEGDGQITYGGFVLDPQRLLVRVWVRLVKG